MPTMNDELIDKYFQMDTENDCIFFTGESLQCLIPERYATYGFLHISERVDTLGIFKMVIDNEYECGLQIPAIISMEIIDSIWKTIDGDKFLIVSLDRGCKLLTTLTLLQNDKIYYSAWREYMAVGHIPLYIDYNNVAFLFDDMKEATGRGISVDHSVLEIIYSHLFRSSDDLNVFYRHTAMDKPPSRISLKSVSYGPSGTFAKIAGSYAQDGYNSALLNQADRNSELEDMWRR